MKNDQVAAREGVGGQPPAEGTVICYQLMKSPSHRTHIVEGGARRELAICYQLMKSPSHHIQCHLVSKFIPVS
jgi:hypothetical protein